MNDTPTPTETGLNPSGEPPSAPIAQREWDKFIFTGPNGIRAGWRLLIFIGIGLIVDTMLVFIAIKLTHHTPVQPHHPIGPEFVIYGDGAILPAALLAAAVMALIERRKFRLYFAPVTTHAWRNLGMGIVWGFLAFSGLLLMLHVPGDYSLGVISTHGAGLVKHALQWGLVFVVVACAEEFLMRGYAQFTLGKGIGFWPAAIILSFLFGFAHHGNIGEDMVGLMSAGLIGMFFAFTLWRTGSLAFAVGMHFMWDYCESFIFGTPDSGFVSKGTLFHAHFQGSPWISGGTVGPEGSVLIFVIIALLFAAFHFAYPRRQYPDPKTL